FAIGPDSEVVIIGDREAEDTKAMFEPLGKEFLPNKVVIFRPAKEEHSEIMSLAPYTRDMSDKNGKATAYVCRNYSCELPTTEKERMLELLRYSGNNE
ncbi:MAG: thioredoxin domain-containing protein, partial [Candidatus Methanoperedens sp.]